MLFKEYGLYGRVKIFLVADKYLFLLLNEKTSEVRPGTLGILLYIKSALMVTISIQHSSEFS